MVKVEGNKVMKVYLNTGHEGPIYIEIGSDEYVRACKLRLLF
jgi:hypothetical protein